MSVQIPATIRDYVRDVLVDDTIGFNAFFEQIAPTYGVQPFKLRYDGNEPNLYLGRFPVAAIKLKLDQDPSPCAILSIYNWDAVGRRNLKVTPSTFSGDILAVVDFYYSYPQTLPPDGDAMFFAQSDAIINAFNGSQSFAGVPQGVSYNNDIKGSPGTMDDAGIGWSQLNTFVLSFGRIG